MIAAFWIALQVVIVIVETFIRLHVTSAKPATRRRGYIVAIGAQFLWLMVMLHTRQYFLLPLLVLDGGIWLRGLLKNP
jgi:hypothetical protein